MKTANAYKFEASEPHGSFEGGTFLRASKTKFPALKGLAVQALHLKPGAVREPHSHPNAQQLDYCVQGRARVGIIGPEGHRQLLDLVVTSPSCPKALSTGSRTRATSRCISSSSFRTKNR
jgi:oxalate decarboxylase/phosphoglucose isomerase-like protein (cupin superfamily)